jgi:ABC-type multidrug transport system permease subunit
VNRLRGEYISSALGITWRNLHVVFTNPALLLPALIFPLFFLAAFAGGLSAVSNVPNFDYPNYTTFVFGFVLLQASALGGVFTGFSIAADFQFGMGRRLLLATRHRSSIIVGYALTAVARALVTWAVVTVVALAAGVEIDGSTLDLAGLYGLALAVNLVAVLFASGVAFRLRTLQAGPLMQFPIFMLLFMGPVYVPQDLLVGWVSTVAKYNPMTAVLNTNRDLLIGIPSAAAITYAIIGGLMVLMAAWAVSGMRRAEAAG